MQDDTSFETKVATTDQIWFRHPEMQARVALAERDFAEGRSTRTQTPEEAQALLDALKQHSQPLTLPRAQINDVRREE